MTTNMKFRVPANLTDCTDRESGRFAIGGVLVQPVTVGDNAGKAAVMVATNGRAMAAVPIPGEFGQESAIIPAELIKTIDSVVSVDGSTVENSSRKGKRSLHITVNRGQVVDGRFPRCGQLLRDAARNVFSPDSQTVAISINATILRDLADAITADDDDLRGCVTLFIQVERPDEESMMHCSNRAIIVRPISGISGNIGVIAPLGMDKESTETHSKSASAVAAQVADMIEPPVSTEQPEQVEQSA